MYARQQHRVGVEHRHDDHYRTPRAMNALVGPAFAIGELEVHLFDLVARFDQPGFVDDRQRFHPWKSTRCTRDARTPEIKACIARRFYGAAVHRIGPAASDAA